MTDIVERLRNADEPLLDDYRIVCEKHGFPNMLLEAADEIERLRLELNRFRLADKQRGIETLATMDGFRNGPSK